jgi:CRP/FNR family transcriptional regulator, cyclic AMP receptor protein
MFIEKASLFQDLSPHFLSELGRTLSDETHEPGSFLFRKGEPPLDLYILREGRVRISYGDEGNVALVVSGGGDAFGWAGLVGREAYTATAECLTLVGVTRVPVRAIMELFERDPADGVAFFRRLARLIGERLENFYKMIPAAHGEKRSTPGF